MSEIEENFMNYTVLIKDFGKIKEATIEIAPLTLFVGDNNSGKSYLLSLLWALQSSNSILFHGLDNIKITQYRKIKDELFQLMNAFPKPILQFLDMLEELSVDISNPLLTNIVEWIESEVTNGLILYDNIQTREIRYIPSGSENSLPLRTSSAVVTELAPLVLILKYKKDLKTIFYEEPEMCLHPKLQQKIAKLLIRLVNNKVFMIATTHSDIILQYINNMCRLFMIKDSSNLLKEHCLIEQDLIDIKDVAVYQLTDTGVFSMVTRLQPSKNGFVIPTFSDALLKILEETSSIQEYDIEQDD